MVAPGFLRFLRRLDPAEVVTPHVLDARDNKVALQFGAGRPVAERRRALRAVDIEQIWEMRARHTQMRARAVGPFSRKVSPFVPRMSMLVRPPVRKSNPVA